MLAAAALALALAAAPGASPALGRLIASRPADSLPGALAAWEASHRGREAASAAFLAGQLRYARGEYRQAAEAFGRAAPRVPGAERAEARYWAGLSWLGAGEVETARSAFEEAARGASPRRAEALLGVARCWETRGQPARALAILQNLLAGDPGEAGPAALELEAALAERLGRPELARRARERLAAGYPRSVEAVRARPAPGPARAAPAAARIPAPAGAVAPSPPAAPPPAARGPLAVQVGAFRDPAAARSMADRVRRAGLGPARVGEIRDAGGAALYAVRVGVYATAEDARAAGERVGRALGVAWRVVAAP